MLCLLSSALVAISLSVASAANNQMTLDEAKSINFHRHRRNTISVSDMNEEIDALLDELATLKTQVADDMNDVQTLTKRAKDDTQVAQDAMAATVSQNNDQLMSRIDDAEKSLDTTKKEILTAVDDQIDEVKDEVSSTIEDMSAEAVKNSTKLQKSVADSIEKFGGDIADANKAMEKSLSDSATDINKKVTSSITTLKADITDPKIHMWSGGSRGHSHGHGWSEFVLDRIEYDTAKPYFEKQTNTRWRALKDGLFRVRWNFMHYTHSHCYRHAAFYVAGRHVIAPQHRHQYHWQEAFLEVTWHIKKNQQFWFQALTNCGNPYRWHSGGSWSGAYNRAQIEYVGQFAGKCSGTNQGLC